MPSQTQVGQSGAKESAREPVRQAWDGEHYTHAEFDKHYGLYMGEVHWQSAQDQMIRRTPAEIRASTSNVAPPAHRLSTVHGATQAKHAEYMMFLQMLLNDSYDIWRSLGEPKAKRASWSSQWNNMTRRLEGLARSVAAHNCCRHLDSSLRSVVQHATVQHISGTSALLFRKLRETCKT